MRLITGLLLLLSFYCHAQDAGELNRRNGFKSIKLGSSIDSVKGAVLKKEFKEHDEFDAKEFETSAADYKFVGEVPVKEIRILTYKNLIYKILITTQKDPRIMQALEKSYGKSVYVLRTTSYNWKAENLSLTFLAHKNSIELIYRSYPIYRMMHEDAGKKIDRIADDF